MNCGKLNALLTKPGLSKRRTKPLVNSWLIPPTSDRMDYTRNRQLVDAICRSSNIFFRYTARWKSMPFIAAKPLMMRPND